MLRVELLGPLRAVVGKRFIDIELKEPIKLREVFMMFDEEIRRMIMDEAGRPQPGLLILVNGVDVRYLTWLDTVVDEDDVVTLIPSIHGG
uniref:MoaD/ThiS family protein n=1 Tax=Caldiarchaeum subterraneum TaxID=311458 RepID=E6N7S1_CALS0|nr:conserved hypothetical protein [Candidatus Caldarchaeum subterraneum]